MAGVAATQQSPMDLYDPTSPFQYDAKFIAAGPTQIAQGAPLGTPPAESIYAQSDAPPSGSGTAYAAAKAGAPGHHQPLFWSVTFIIIGSMLLSHAAYVNIKER